MMLQGTQGDFLGRSARHCAAAASCSPTGTGRTAAPVPAAQAHQATVLNLPQGLRKTVSELNTALLDWMETGGIFSIALQAWGADACCRWISSTSSTVPLALSPKCSLTSASQNQAHRSSLPQASAPRSSLVLISVLLP